MADRQLDRPSAFATMMSCTAVRNSVDTCCAVRPAGSDMSKLREDIAAKEANGFMSSANTAGLYVPPQEPAPAPGTMREKVTAVLIKKATKDLRLGVRLAARKDGSTTGVEVIEVHPDGPLATVIQKGDVMLRSARRAWRQTASATARAHRLTAASVLSRRVVRAVNSTECNYGYKEAAIALREACGVVECAPRPATHSPSTRCRARAREAAPSRSHAAPCHAHRTSPAPYHTHPPGSQAASVCERDALACAARAPGSSSHDARAARGRLCMTCDVVHSQNA
jgi:hypothetical protein